jgi:uncharacterized membrane protein
MHLALIIVGAIFGLAVDSLVRGATSWFAVLLGGFVGFALAEFRALRSRGDALEGELESLKGALLRSQRERADSKEGSIAAPAAASSDFDPQSASVADAHVANAQSPPSPRGPEAESPILRFIREYFTSGNTLVRVGVLILFFGIAFLLRYVAEHSHVPIQLRLSAVAVGGVALLVLGWRLRAKRTGYALALQGGGVGILYLTTFAALRLYAVLSPATAFAILVVLAVFSAALAVLQDSQAFALLGVTGGFLAPILASTGEGSHVVLFSYFAVLNASILAIAWYKAWQPLNLAGFAFTFLISTAWGVLHYRSELFASIEPFLALFLIFYLAIAILFSIRQPPNLRGYVDGTLVFGTPMAAFGYQAGMLREQPYALALSAAAFGSIYFMLAWLLYRRQRSSQRLLVEAFTALGVVFFTVATPLALNGTATGVTWALEGAALAWIGARQNRLLPRVFGPLLQIAVALLQLSDTDGFFAATAPPLGLYLARAVTAIVAVLTAVILSKYQERLRPFEGIAAPVMFFMGVAQWLFCGLVEIYGHVSHGYDASSALVFVALTALISSELSRRTSLTLARLPALALLPAMLIFAALELVPPTTHPFDFAGWAAWPVTFAVFYIVCRRHEGSPEGRLANYLHVVSAWLLVALLSWQLAWLIDRSAAGRGSWPAVGWMLIPALALLAVPRLVERFPWPVRMHREAYVVYAGSGLALYLALWSLVTNFSLPADPYPFPFLPLLNVLDLAQALVLGVTVRYYQQLKSGRYPILAEIGAAGFLAMLASLAFIWLNAALVRTLHHWAGVPLDLEDVLRSTLVQTSLSIFWTVLALATMLVAARRAERGVWITGACLLAVTIVKLFVIDLSRVGTVERIVSFVGVGLLTLVIGYFSPLPPSATAPRTTV